MKNFESIELFLEDLAEHTDREISLIIDKTNEGWRYKIQAFDVTTLTSCFGDGGSIEGAVLDLHRNILKNITY